MYVKLSAAIVPMLNTNDKVSTFFSIASGFAVNA